MRLARLEWQLQKLARIQRRTMTKEAQIVEMIDELVRILEPPPPRPELKLVWDDED